jgi:hypothetical protein
MVARRPRWFFRLPNPTFVVRFLFFNFYRLDLVADISDERAARYASDQIRAGHYRPLAIAVLCGQLKYQPLLNQSVMELYTIFIARHVWICWYAVGLGRRTQACLT